MREYGRFGFGAAGCSESDCFRAFLVLSKTGVYETTQEKCTDCHHGAKDGKQVPYTEGMEIGKCESCHNEKVLAGKTKGPLKLDTLKGAGHGNCLECHKEMVKKDPAMKDKKLDKCTSCHAK